MPKLPIGFETVKSEPEAHTAAHGGARRRSARPEPPRTYLLSSCHVSHSH